MVVLARALSPNDFGLFKILVVVSTFAMLVNEAGIPDALIQRRDLTPAHHATAWWMSIGLALLTVGPALQRRARTRASDEDARVCARACACYAFLFCSRAQPSPPTRGCDATCASARSPLPTSSPRSRFLPSHSYCCGIGCRPGALAGGLAARFAIHAITILFAGGRTPLGLPTSAAARDLGHFATKVLGGRTVDALSSNIDFVLIGRLLGSSALGFYSMAWDLLRFIPDRVFRIAGRVTLPTFCHLQDQTDQLAKAYLNFSGYLSRIILPIVGCAAIAAPELIKIIYGPKWMPAAVPMQLLACGLLLVGLRLAIGSVYYAKNHPEFDFYVHATRLVLVVVTIFGLARLGLVGVSMGRSAVEVVMSIAGQWLVCMLLGIGLTDLFVAILPGARLALMCAIAVIAGKITANALARRESLLCCSSWDRPRSFIAGANLPPRCGCSETRSVAAKPAPIVVAQELQ